MATKSPDLPPEEAEALAAKQARDDDLPKQRTGGSAPNGSESGSDESDEEEPMPIGYWKMFQASEARKYLGKSWVVFSLFFTIYYILQFGLALCCANFRSQSKGERLEGFDKGGMTFDKSTFKICQMYEVNTQDRKSQEFIDAQLQSAAVYDTAFLLLGIFHIIEWVRTALLMGVTCLGGVPLLLIYQFTSINALFGVVAYIFAHYARFSEAGQNCKEVHPNRAQFLTAEIIFFYVVFGICILFVLAFPKMAYELYHGQWRRKNAKKLAKAAEAEKEAAAEK